MKHSSKAPRVIGVLLVIMSAWLAVGVKLVFHACRGTGMDGMEKSCQVAENAVFIVALVMLLLAVLSVLLKNRIARVVLSLAVCALAIFAAVIPNNVIRLCMMPGMRCLSVMQPCVILFGILTAVVAFISFLLNVRKAAQN